MGSKTAKIAISLVGVFILVGGLVAGVILVQKSQDIKRQAAPATSLFFVPATQNKNQGNSFSAAVTMDTAENRVTGVDIRLKFDPLALEIVSITKGAGIAVFDQTIVNTFDNSLGSVSFSTFTLDKTKAVQGSGLSVLNISAKVKESASPATYQISFEAGTAVTGVGEGQNVLISSTPARIVVSGETSTPTATPAPTSTPTNAPNTGGGWETPTSAPTPTPVLSQPLPESGVSFPFILSVGLGVVVLLGSLFILIGV